VNDVAQQERLARHLMDLGLLLLELYLQHGSEGSVSLGWSRGSLHYTSVESAVSRHLAANCSNLLQEALDIVHSALQAPEDLESNLRVALLSVQSQVEFAQGKLSLAIAAEAQRMAQVACTTASTVDEGLVVKLQNKARTAEAHGLDLLEAVLPGTCAKLLAVLDDLAPDSDLTVWEQYRTQVASVVLNRPSTGVSRPSSPVKGISVFTSDAAVLEKTAGGIPPALSHMLLRVTTSKISCDVSLLVGEYFTRQLIERKVGDINAAFVQCMAPPPPVSALPALKDAPAQDSTPLPLPKGITPRPSSDALSKLGNDHLIKDSTPSSPVYPARDGQVATTSVPPSVSGKTTTVPAPTKRKNFLYPLLLHTGTQDLLQQLLDREFLVHQNRLLAKLADQQEAAEAPQVDLPTPVSPVSKARTGGRSPTRSPTRNPAAAPQFDLLFDDELTAEEEQQLREIHNSSSAVATKFSNVVLIHSWRQAKAHYEAAVQGYVKLFGANSVLGAEARVYLANLLRCFGKDDEAKPLYELALKIFKHHNLATYQLPQPVAAHCWLGLGSYFSVPDVDNAPTFSKWRQNAANAVSRHHSDLALRLYEEALSIYKCVYPTTHYDVALTAQALAPVLSALQKYERGQDLLQECIDSARLTLSRDRIMQRYLNRQLRNATQRSKRASRGSSAADQGKGKGEVAVVERLERAVESNEQALQATINILSTALVAKAKFLDCSKQHHLAIALYKEAIVCFRELRLSMVRRYQQRLEAQQPAGASSTGRANTVHDGEEGHDAEGEDEEEDAEQVTTTTTQPERELALRIAQTMRDLAQSLFDEGLKQMGGRRAGAQALPDFQYRHALYILNRYVMLFFCLCAALIAGVLRDVHRATTSALAPVPASVLVASCIALYVDFCLCPRCLQSHRDLPQLRHRRIRTAAEGGLHPKGADARPAERPRPRPALLRADHAPLHGSEIRELRGDRRGAHGVRSPPGHGRGAR
jgi:tetratricopeptide (TPR) repeat protein